MKHRVPAEIIERASEWFVELRDPVVAPERHAAFAEWLRQSPVHVRAYLELAGIWDEAARLDAGCDFGLESALRSGAGAANVVRVGADRRFDGAITDDGASATAGPPVNGPSAPRLRLPWAAAASVMLAAGALAILLWSHQAQVEYRAPAGEQRMVTLDDGSIVHLNSGARLQAELRPGMRSLDLLAGQALFEVAKDVRRPFVVRSGEATIRALGTAFDVNRDAAHTIVTVVEGRVLVSSERRTSAARRLADADGIPDAPKPAAETLLSAGEQAIVTSEGAVQRQQAADVGAATTWLEEERVFTGEPLGLVAEEFNRHNERAIRIEDPALADVRVNAVFHSTRPDSLVTFISRLENVEVDESESEIRISRRE